MTALGYLIDPGGLPGVRPGINLWTPSSGESPQETKFNQSEPERTANGAAVVYGLPFRYEFSWECHLPPADFQKVERLTQWLLKRRASGLNSDTVVYNLAQPFTEEATARSRYKVPGTEVISNVVLGNGLHEFTYWVALQGWLAAESVRVASELYKINFSFWETTVLTRQQEPL